MKNKIYETSELSLAAFLIMNGLVLIKAKKNDNGRFSFEIENPNENAEALAIEYLNSDFAKFDNHVRSLKKIIYVR